MERVEFECWSSRVERDKCSFTNTGSLHFRNPNLLFAFREAA